MISESGEINRRAEVPEKSAYSKSRTDHDRIKNNGLQNVQERDDQLVAIPNTIQIRENDIGCCLWSPFEDLEQEEKYMIDDKSEWNVLEALADEEETSVEQQEEREDASDISQKKASVGLDVLLVMDELSLDDYHDEESSRGVGTEETSPGVDVGLIMEGVNTKKGRSVNGEGADNLEMTKSDAGTLIEEVVIVEALHGTQSQIVDTIESMGLDTDVVIEELEKDLAKSLSKQEEVGESSLEQDMAVSVALDMDIVLSFPALSEEEESRECNSVCENLTDLQEKLSFSSMEGDKSALQLEEETCISGNTEATEEAQCKESAEVDPIICIGKSDNDTITSAATQQSRDISASSEDDETVRTLPKIGSKAITKPVSVEIKTGVAHRQEENQSTSSSGFCDSPLQAENTSTTMENRNGGKTADSITGPMKEMLYLSDDLGLNPSGETKVSSKDWMEIFNELQEEGHVYRDDNHGKDREDCQCTCIVS
jgi:hypothetical protein